MRGLGARLLLLLLLLRGAVEGSGDSQRGRTAKGEMEQGEREDVGAGSAEGADGGDLRVLTFQELGSGKRHKRSWVIPTISVPENDPGPFPKTLVQIRSDRHDGEFRYSVLGPGADQDPTGVFIIDAVSGLLSVTKTLDRELIAEYQLKGYVVDASGRMVEKPVDLIISVIDMNDNRPQFAKPVFQGSVPEGSSPGTPVMTVTASDADDPFSANGMIRYKIASQIPQVPSERMFTIHNSTGLISTMTTGLDTELAPKYTLVVEACDMDGSPDIGLGTKAMAVIAITDKNDNAPEFTATNFSGVARENTLSLVATVTVTDADKPGTAAWRARYVILGGDPGEHFAMETDLHTNNGQLFVVRPVDFESLFSYNLVIAVENEVPLENAQFGPASTATVTVMVEDKNEAPVFEPAQRQVTLPEGLPIGYHVTNMVAHDPDMAQRQTVRYERLLVPGDWLDIDPVSGKVTTAVVLDREAALVQADTYIATFLAIDDGGPAASGTGSLVLLLSDINDHAPTVSPDETVVCEGSAGVNVSADDADDEALNGRPFSFKLPSDNAALNRFWSIHRIDGSSSQLRLKVKLQEGFYHVPLIISDSGNPTMSAVSELGVKVCACDSHGNCVNQAIASLRPSATVFLIILLPLLILVPLCLVYIWRRGNDCVTKQIIIRPKYDDDCDNIIQYNEEGGGEENQDYDPLLLLPPPPPPPPPPCLSEELPYGKGPDARRDDERQPRLPPLYSSGVLLSHAIGDFIDESLRAVDADDATAAPHDVLQVYGYEGSGSWAGSLSSICTSSSGDSDWDHLSSPWDPRFRKLADVFRGCGCQDD